MMMLANLKPTVAAHIKFNPLKPVIDNFAFKMHYRVTVILLIIACVLVCGREYFGEHIRCISDQGVPEHVIKTYCFFMATFTIVRHYNESLLAAEALPHPGVGPMLDSDKKLHHTYYQWVPFVLFIQAMCFYMPHYVWKKKEGGRIKALVDGLQLASLALEDNDMDVAGKKVPSKSTLEKKLDIIRKDIILRLRITRTWSTWLVAMEVANLLHLMFQIWITNVFLNGNFIGLGPVILNGDMTRISDPLETVFPKVTKCIFHKYGPTGSIQQHDALCVMALNIIHEKIYAVLWFWFLILFILSVLAVVWRFLSWCFYRRPRFTKYNAIFFWQPGAGMDKNSDRNAKFDPQNVVRVVNGCQFGDWLFLYYLAKNMHGFIFQELFRRLAEELQKQEIDGRPGYDKGAEPVLLKQTDLSYDDETLPLRAQHKID